MSADNGIYILVLKDQCRVIHAQAIDNLYWWHCDEDRNEINPLRVVEYYKDVNSHLRDEARKVAINLLEEIGYTEYGVSEINDLKDKTWDEVIAKAKIIAREELAFLSSKGNNDGRWDSDVSRLDKFLREV